MELIDVINKRIAELKEAEEKARFALNEISENSNIKGLELQLLLSFVVAKRTELENVLELSKTS